MYEYTEDDLTAFMEVAKKLIINAGKLIEERISTQKTVTLKVGCGGGNSSAVLTETDQEVEKLLVSGLSTAFPDHKFIGEEEVSEAGIIKEFSNNPTWIIDPIDGTMNFVHKNPLICTSIGLAINRKIVLGIVNCPMIDKIYTAIKGKGAFCNDIPIRTSGCKTLSDAMVIMEQPCGANDEKQNVAVENVKILLSSAHALRSPGPAAMDIAWIGSGSADAFFHSGIHCWDMAAGVIIVTEAGGCVTAQDGSSFDLMGKNCLVTSTKELNDEMKNKIMHLPSKREFEEICSF